MGCTSSVPNMVTANANPTDKVHFSEDTKIATHTDDTINSTNDENGICAKVLPPCDTLGESIQLDRNNSRSLLDTSNVYIEKDSYANGHVIEGVNTLIDHNDSHAEEKLSSLEDVVEKVVELFVADNTDVAKITTEITTDQTKATDQTIIENIEEKCEAAFEKVPSAETKPSESKEHLEEASPSQSTSSRATRWEALADIAAELPPSLAVDPVTGQIYALSK